MKRLIYVLLISIFAVSMICGCLMLTACKPDTGLADDFPIFSSTNADGKIIAYQGVQQANSLTFANAINMDNQYIFFYFNLGTVNKVPLYTSVALQYQYDTEVTFKFSELTSESLSNSITKSTTTVNTHSYTGGFKVGFTEELETEEKFLFQKFKGKLSAAQETEHKWTNDWGNTVTDSQMATTSYLSQYSRGYAEKVSFSEAAGFKRGNYYRMSFYDSVNAFGVLVYDVAKNSYAATTDFVLKNNSTVRVWEESKDANFDYQEDKTIQFDVNSAVAYAEKVKSQILADSETLGKSEKNPYLISNADEFVQKINELDGGAKYFRLTKDIDFANKTIAPITSFYGHLDGAGYTLRNLNIKTSSSDGLKPTDADAYYIGLFQYMYGKVSNLKIENATINVENLNKRIRVGVFVGGIYNGNVTNCTVSGNIKVVNNKKDNTAWVGGLAGYIENSQLIHCSAKVGIQIKNDDIINGGGLVGRVCGGTISSSSAQGNISIDGSQISPSDAYVDVGGLAGRVIKNGSLNYLSKIENSYATGNVYCDIVKGDAYAGGLVGRLYDSNVEFVYATGEVKARNKTSKAYAAGLIARAEDSKIVNAFSTSNVYAHGNYQGAEKKYSFYGHMFAAEKNLSLWKLYYNTSAAFKSGASGTELKWNTDFYRGVSLSDLKSDRFQAEEMQLDKNIWVIVNGQYPTLK